MKILPCKSEKLVFGIEGCACAIVKNEIPTYIKFSLGKLLIEI